MRHGSLNFIRGFTVCCGLLLLAIPAHAQRRWSFSIQFQRGEVARLMDRASNLSSNFLGSLDRALDQSALEGSFREDRINERARVMDNELTMARESFERGESSYEVSLHLSRAINAARPINRVLSNRRMTYEAEREWSLLRSELNQLASIYGVRQLNY